ncbi:hypothetical protein O181_056534 [Austropuccinia psidii MF-1]|uniref:Transmembrane protein n=1 Tax=Austropuccinia psidii MF-1 TaxID=1389203 RepID=A0A9Q3HVR5_9BASI|nr:hypothetical protein [Austropuccinia psidii MF-1]
MNPSINPPSPPLRSTQIKSDQLNLDINHLEDLDNLTLNSITTTTTTTTISSHHPFSSSQFSQANSFKKTCLGLMKNYFIYFSIFFISSSFILISYLHLSIGQSLFNQLNHSNLNLESYSKLIIHQNHLENLKIQKINNDSIHLIVDLQLALNLKSMTLNNQTKNHHLSKKIQSNLLNWLINHTNSITIKLDSPVQFHSNLSSQDLIHVQILDSFNLPIYNQSNLSTISLNLIIYIISPDLINQFLTQTYSNHLGSLTLIIQNLNLNLNGNWLSSGFSNLIKHKFKIKLKEFKSIIHFKIPTLPPIFQNLLQEIQIDNYSFYPLKSSTQIEKIKPNPLGIQATISIPNPFLQLDKFIKKLDLNLNIPWRFSLAIFLDSISIKKNHTSSISNSKVLMGLVSTLPFHLNHSLSRLSLTAKGNLIQQTPHNSETLSSFLNRFLKGLSTNVTIRSTQVGNSQNQDWIQQPSYSNQLILKDSYDQKTSYYMNQILKNLDVKLPFPGSTNKDFLKELVIKDMSISLSGTKMLCSGTALGVVNLPQEIMEISNLIQIDSIWPNVILLDGKLPSSNENLIEEEYPTNAFGRLVTQGFIPSRLIKQKHENQKETKLTLEASIKDVPLEILDGRASKFRRYATKYVFRNHQTGLETSVLGHSDGIGQLSGLGKIKFDKLKVKGTFFVGGKETQKEKSDL